MNSPSIKRSLLIRCGSGVAVLLCILCAGIYLLVRESLYRELDASIQETASLLGNQVELENDGITFEWQEGLGTNQSLVADGLFQFWDENSNATTRSPGLHSRDLPRFTGIDGKPLVRNVTLPDGRRGRAVGLRIYPFVLADEIENMKLRGRVIDTKSLPHVLVVARDAEPVQHTLDRLRWVSAGGMLLTLGLGFALIHRVVGVTLRPIDDLSAQVKDRAEHQLDLALEVPGEMPSELAGLAENFDRLLGRVAAIRQREKDFIRHAAHELRTPIAGLQATAELALSQNRDAAAYAAHLSTCHKTATELGELVKRLTALARIGQPAKPVTIVSLDVRRELKDLLAPFLPRFDANDLKVSLDCPDGKLEASGDRTSLRIILTNLLDNANSYATPGTEVSMIVRAHSGRVEISISNHVTDPPPNPDQLFEPLFRSNNSRHDAASHLGIGLTLSLETAVAMGANLKARVLQDNRIEFILSLPQEPH